MMRGRILIVAGSADGKEPILNMHDAGEFFGEIALLDGAGRSASAIADAASDLLTSVATGFSPYSRRGRRR